MKIVISPYSRQLSSGKRNPKNFPYWQELINMLVEREFEIVQLGIRGEEEFTGVKSFEVDLSFPVLKRLILSANLWISVDNFLPHFCNTFNSYGIVIFGYSDPNIFGYSNNVNLLKDRKLLRPFQFQTWEEVEYDKNVFVGAKEVFDKVLECLHIT